MDNYRIAVIDGTGVWNDETYEREMKDSFCSQIARLAGPKARYWRGPSALGLEVSRLANHTANWLEGEYRCNVKPPRLFAAGYSRGASIAIMAAERLQIRKITLDGMFLFDPVARHPYGGGEIIPANVHYVRVARRSLDPALVDKYEKNRLTKYLPVTNYIRPWFGRTALRYLGTGDFQVAEFRGSHGALGGVGWKEVVEDGPCQKRVAAWMSKALQSQGLRFAL